MGKLNDILHELGISKVKLAKFLGVSRQMIYNYLELDDINKWPKDKKVLLLNLLGIKSGEELDNIKIDTDYILDVETRLNSLTDELSNNYSSNSNVFNNLGKKQKELLSDIIEIIKDNLDLEDDEEKYYTYKYLFHFLQTMETNKELKYILGYVAKSSGFVDPKEFVYKKELDDQFVFESILFSAFTLYESGGASKSKLAESHARFEKKIADKMEEKLSRTMELNSIKSQALKELGYTEINEHNISDVIEKMAEIESRKVTNN